MPDDLETPDNEQQPEQHDSPVITSLRKDRDDAKIEAEAAKRELTLHKAGLGELTDKQMKALTGAHEGLDWTPELLKETANELGFAQQQAPEKPAEPQITAEERASMQRINAASGGQPPPPAPELEAAIRNAETREDVLAVLRDADMLEIQ